jgi:hypothetical protein
MLFHSVHDLLEGSSSCQAMVLWYTSSHCTHQKSQVHSHSLLLAVKVADALVPWRTSLPDKNSREQVPHWNFPSWESCKKNLLYSALRECEALALDLQHRNWQIIVHWLGDKTVLKTWLQLKTTALYLDTKKWESCRARFQWPTTWQWCDLGSNSTIHFS